jgi:hypothetical protein
MSLDERLHSLTLVAERIDAGDVEAALRKVRAARTRTPRRRPIMLTVVALAAAVAALVGVTANQTGQPDSNVTTTPSAADWQDLLDATPADVQGIITIHDFERLADQLDVPVPGPEASDEAITAYRDALWNLPDFPIRPRLPLNTATPSEVRQGLGFDHRSIARTITFGGLEPVDAVDILIGRFDVTAVDAAVKADPQWAPKLTTASHGGTSFYSWGGDQIDVLARTSLRPLGQGGKLLVEPSTAVWALTTTSMRSVIDARNKEEPRASDDKGLAAVVARLDRQGSVSANVMKASDGFDVDVQAIGWGYRRAGDQWVVEVGFAYSSQAAAVEGERRLRQRLDQVDVRSGRILRETLQPINIGVAGTLVVGSFTYTDPDVTLGESVSSRGAMASLMPVTFGAAPPTSR